jgi:hypothetical protein
MDGNLQNLNPIITPEPVGWLPLAPGWIVLGVILGALLTVFAWRRWLAWRDQRYRREALRELTAMTDLGSLPGLLKRAALSAWPREEVAALSGPAWHRFLDDSAGMETFSGKLGQQLDQLAYGKARPADDEETRLREAARDWLQKHRRAR